MLVDFNFKNYMSFKDECKFTMKATADKTHFSNLVKCNGDRVSLSKIMFGANASGKTNFIKALGFVKGFVKMSNIMLEKNSIRVKPFEFRANAYDKISEFSMVFMKNGLKHSYSFSCNTKKVIDERLDIYYSAKPTNIFTRKNTNEYTFTKDAKELNEIKNKNTENKLFLVTSATWNYENTKDAVDFISNDIIVNLRDTKTDLEYNLNRINKEGKLEDYKNFCLDFLRNADFSIMDIDVEFIKFSDDFEGVNVLEYVKKINAIYYEQIIDNGIPSIRTVHAVANGGKEEKYYLDLHNESLGTVSLFNLTAILYYVFREGKTLLIDEIDRSLHPLIVKYIIKMFLNKEINNKNAQIICNTHDTSLFDLDIFRRDEILLTERDYKTGATTIIPLSDYSPRKDENVERSYMLGRFGAIPFIIED